MPLHSDRSHICCVTSLRHRHPSQRSRRFRCSKHCNGAYHCCGPLLYPPNATLSSFLACSLRSLLQEARKGELQEESGFKVGLFGVLYTLAKEKLNDSKKVRAGTVHCASCAALNGPLLYVSELFLTGHGLMRLHLTLPAAIWSSHLQLAGLA